MAKFKVAKSNFKGLEEGKIFEVKDEIELTVKRADEINAKLEKEYGIKGNLVRLDEPKENEKPKK